jgi:methylenetetrahydrofolate dehydrogenase (NADP+)/methenyltetrahydrofolate cyclohydrolase
MGKTISGRVIADEVLDGVTAEVEQLKAKGIHPSLAVILVGDDNASQVYVNNKRKACERVGIVSHIYTRGADTTQEDLMALVEELNAREDIHGILCQSPIPRHLDEKAVINAISQDKDVDAFHPLNVGHIMIGDCRFFAVHPAGVMEMLHHEQVKIEGAHCVVIGRSNIVGKPMAMLMLKESATVTVMPLKTPDLRAITSQATF